MEVCSELSLRPRIIFRYEKEIIVKMNDLDADPDPAVFIIDLQDVNKKQVEKKFFCILLFEGTFTSFFKDQKSK